MKLFYEISIVILTV